MESEVLCGIPPDATSKRYFASRKTLLVMKLVILFTILTSLQAWSKGYTQTISISARQVSLEKIFKEIRRQTDYRFIYTKEELSTAKPVSLEVKNASIGQVLSLCFLDQPLSYTIVENHIIVKKKATEARADATIEQVSLIDVKGRVLNERGEAVDANISVKGTSNVTSTDEGGYFLIKGVDANATLVITGVNVETYEVGVNGRTDLATLYLKIKISKLDEVQIVGYGTNTQRYNVGSVTKITSEEIAQQPVSNPLQALQGRVPGLEVTSTSGVPGAAVTIQIRGQNSLTSTPNPVLPLLSTPLFIIDGVPFAPQNSNLNQFNSIAAPFLGSGLYNSGYSGLSPFSVINPSDIESIEILRDADATAIFGSRGANGVILITTKKAIAGKAKFNLNLYTGVNTMPQTMRMMNTHEYVEMRREAFKNDNIIPTAANASDLFLFDTTQYTDWKEYFFGGRANSLDVNTSVSGEERNTQYLAGIGFHRETYIFPGDFDDKRIAVNSSLTHHSTDKKFLFGLSTNYSFYKTNSIGTPNLLSVLQLEPDYPDLKDAQGNLIWNFNGVSLGTGIGPAANPLSYLKRKYSVDNYNLISNLHIDYTILPGLTFRSSFGYNTLNSTEYSGSPKASFNPGSNQVSSASFGTTTMRSWIAEPQAEYKKTIKKTKIDLLLGSTLQQNLVYSTLISASGYNNDDLIESISAAPNKTASDASSNYKYNAFFGRLNIIHSSKYILNLSGRRDGSSRFGPSKQFGNFGAVGAGWLFSQESFTKRELSFISYGKLRVSYGLTGADAIGDYQYIARWAPTDNTYLGSLGYLPQNLGNPNFSWGTTKKFEGGLELAFLADRILLNAAYYQNRSGNQLISYPLPAQTGFASVVENWNAVVQNTGVELLVQGTVIRKKNLSWNISGNVTAPRNKLLSFPGIENSSYKYQYIVGQSLRIVNALRYAGINDTTGVYEFWTANKQRTSNPDLTNDKSTIGNLDPKFFGGIGNTLNFKGLTLSIFLEFKKQLGLNYLSQVYFAGRPGRELNQPAIFLSRWQKPGDQSEFPKFTTTTSSPAARSMSRFALSDGVYSDASYIKCKTLSLSYGLPNKYLKKMKMQSCSIYLNCQNLFTITNYKGNDPETQSFYGVPVLKTVTVGTRLSF
jgi:TonB-linked SusC/RagA family outer membrane protein